MEKKTKVSSKQPFEPLPLASSFGALVREIHRMQARLLQDELKKDGISSGGWYFLRALWSENGLTQREMSLRVGVNEATTRTAIDRMEAESLVQRTQDGDDRRKWIIKLTPRAQRLQSKLIDLAIRINSVTTQGLSQVKHRQLISMLQHVHGNLERLSLAPDRRSTRPGQRSQKK